MCFSVSATLASVAFLSSSRIALTCQIVVELGIGDVKGAARTFGRRLYVPFIAPHFPLEFLCSHQYISGVPQSKLLFEQHWVQKILSNQ